MGKQHVSSPPLALRYTPEPIRTRWLALFPIFSPFLLLGVLFLTAERLVETRVQGATLGSVFFVVQVLLFLIGYVTGWVRGFPRWWWSYPLFLIMLALLLQNSTTPGFRFFGMDSHTQLWGWRAWMPLAVGTFLAIIISIFTHPYRRFWQGIWQEPTRVSFAFFSFLPWFTIALFDETQGNFKTPFIIATFLVVLVAGWFYLSAKNPISRLLILVISAMGITFVNLTVITLYWNNRQEFWMSSPASWQDNILGGIMGLAMVAILLVIPVAIIEFFRLLKSLQRRTLHPVD